MEPAKNNADNQGIVSSSSRKKRRVLVFICLALIFLSFATIFMLNIFQIDSITNIAIAGGIGCLCTLIMFLLVIKTKKDRDATEEALRENQERYLSIISASTTGAWEYHATTGYLWCSPEYFKMLGYDPCEFLRDNKLHIQDIWSNLLHPDDKAAAEEGFVNYLANGSEGIYESYFRMKHSDGSWVWIWSRGQTLRHDGKLTSMTVGTHINITEKKLLELELLRHNQKLLKYAFMNAHEVRGPVARLLGLVQIFRLEEKVDNAWFSRKSNMKPPLSIQYCLKLRLNSTR